MDELCECAKKLHRAAKELYESMNELREDDDYNERSYGRGGYGNYRMDDDMDDEEDYNERRGVPGTGRYGRSRYRR